MLPDTAQGCLPLQLQLCSAGPGAACCPPGPWAPLRGTAPDTASLIPLSTAAWNYVCFLQPILPK